MWEDQISLQVDCRPMACPQKPQLKWYNSSGVVWRGRNLLGVGDDFEVLVTVSHVSPVGFAYPLVEVVSLLV